MLFQPSASKLLKIISSVGILFFMCVFACPAPAAEYTVAVLPFKINGPQQYRYLSNGIADMLATRLYQKDAIAIADPQKIKDIVEDPQNMSRQIAARIGERLRAEYVGFGTVTILGQSLSLDATFVDTSTPAESFTFSRQSDKVDSLIMHIDALAREFKAYLLGGAQPTQETATAESAVPATDTPPAEESAGGDFFQLEKPDSPFIEMLEKQQKNKLFWKSQQFKMLINGIDVADVDQDGLNELVMASREKVLIYQSKDNLLEPVQILSTSPGRQNIALDVADINGNGYPEIFVTCLGEQGQRVKSFVLEYTGQTYQKIVQDVPWFFRVSPQPQGKPVLLGQKQYALKDYSGEIFVMQAGDEPGYHPERRLLPEQEINLLGLGYGYINKTATKEIVAYDPRNRIRIFDDNGNEIWKSADKYGGSTLFITQDRHEPGEPPERAYLPVPLRVLDIDGNGQTEVVTILNHEVLGSHLKSFRYYDKGQIVSLSWDGIGLALDWKTRELSGQVRDFRIADMNNDGRKELVALLIKEEGRVMFRGAKSMIISYPLDSKQ